MDVSNHITPACFFIAIPLPVLMPRVYVHNTPKTTISFICKSPCYIPLETPSFLIRNIQICIYRDTEVQDTQLNLKKDS